MPSLSSSATSASPTPISVFLPTASATGFFSDLDQPNVMDPKPFFEFNMLSCSDKAVEELKTFSPRKSFNVDETIEAAAVLKYIEGMKQALVRQLSTPDEEFSRWLTKQVYSKLLTQVARETIFPT